MFKITDIFKRKGYCGDIFLFIIIVIEQHNIKKLCCNTRNNIEIGKIDNSIPCMQYIARYCPPNVFLTSLALTQSLQDPNTLT